MKILLNLKQSESSDSSDSDSSSSETSSYQSENKRYLKKKINLGGKELELGELSDDDMINGEDDINLD